MLCFFVPKKSTLIIIVIQVRKHLTLSSLIEDDYEKIYDLYDVLCDQMSDYGAKITIKPAPTMYSNVGKRKKNRTSPTFLIKI